MNRSERISAVLVVASGAFVAFYSYRYLKLGMIISPGAGFLPFLLGIALILLGVLWFLQKSIAPAEAASETAERESPEEAESAAEADRGLSRKMLVGIVVMSVYALLFERMGYFLATLIFMLGWQILVEKEKWLKSLLITAVSTIAMYSLFRYVLSVYLPRGTWF